MGRDTAGARSLLVLRSRTRAGTACERAAGWGDLVADNAGECSGNVGIVEAGHVTSEQQAEVEGGERWEWRCGGLCR